MGAKSIFYAYLVPSEKISGVAATWAECEKKVSGRPGARYRGFKTRREAEEWLKSGARYEIKKAKKSSPGIYFDAGTGRGAGVEVSVTDERGRDLLKKNFPGLVLNQHGKLLQRAGITNNYGELLACFYALKISLKRKIKFVFGDSRLVTDYWSRGIINRKKVLPGTAELAEAVAELRREFEESGGKITRVSGADNPADLGFHR